MFNCQKLPNPVISYRIVVGSTEEKEWKGKLGFCKKCRVQRNIFGVHIGSYCKHS